MAFTFPLAWTSFAALLPIMSASWRLRRFEEMTWTGTSRPDVSELAEPRWSCRVQLGVLHHEEAAEIQALIELHGSAHPFLLHDPARPAPRHDPTGAILGAATPQIASISAAGVAVQGLPAGYQIARGDLLALTHGGVQFRALHVALADVSANGSGLTPAIPLLPAPRPLAATGHPVTLIKATGLMVALPDSYDPGHSDGQVVRGMSFDAIEAW